MVMRCNVAALIMEEGGHEMWAASKNWKIKEMDYPIELPGKNILFPMS